MAEAQKSIFSLWLTSHTPSQRGFQKVIDELATKWDAPSFCPHITLLGPIEIERVELRNRVHSLKTGRMRFSVGLGPVQAENNEFKSLYLPVALTPGAEHLLALRKWVDDMFGHGDVFGISTPFSVDPFYMPHVSLMYKKMAHGTKIKQVIPSLPRLHQYYDVHQLEIWSTEGPVSTWKMDSSISL